METIRIPAGKWVISADGTPAYFIYKLHKGKVSYHEDGFNIREVEVGDGMEPVTLGFTAALRSDRMHRASVRAETELEVEQVYIDSIRASLAHDVPDDIQREIKQMIDYIDLKNHLISLRKRLARIEDIPDEKLKVPPGLPPEAAALVEKVIKVYKRSRAE